MKLLRVFTIVLVLALIVGAVPLKTTNAAQQEADQSIRDLIYRGSTGMPSVAQGSGRLEWPEFAVGKNIESKALQERLAQDRPGWFNAEGFINRSYSTRPDAGAVDPFSAMQESASPIPVVESTKIAEESRGLLQSFEGLNHFDSRTANNGNQFSTEPPDQGLCAGNGYVMETVNQVLQVYDDSGNPVTAPTDLNTFYNYAPAIDRTTLTFGPFVFDVSCLYDHDTRRWFHVAATIETDPVTGEFLGPNHIDLAVSESPDPTGKWNLYSIPAQNDGTEGTPDHDCDLGPCFGDYPHIGADRYGFYISTNEYSFFGDQYTTAQIYAMSKNKLARGVKDLKFVHLDNLFVDGTPGHTVWPAQAPAGQNFVQLGGVEFFLSSLATEEAGNTTGFDDRLAIWALAGTATLDWSRPKLFMIADTIKVKPYGVPPLSEQKEGDTPLRDCINDTEVETPFGPGCWQFFFTEEPAHDEVISHPDSLDSRMQQVWFASGRLWGSMGTIVKVDGQVRAGITYFIIGPGTHLNTRSLRVKQGYLAVKDNDLSMPAIAALPNGRGVIAFSLMGEDYFPSAAYAPVDKTRGHGHIHLAGEGAGPTDGFTSYKAFVGDPPRTRWGDYGAAATDGRTIWIGSEYIAQTCTFEEFLADFTCGDTRTSLANWSTHISQVRPVWP